MTSFKALIEHLDLTTQIPPEMYSRICVMSSQQLHGDADFAQKVVPGDEVLKCLWGKPQTESVARIAEQVIFSTKVCFCLRVAPR